MIQPRFLNRLLTAGLILSALLSAALAGCTPASGTAAAPSSTPADAAGATPAPAALTPTAVRPTLTPTSLPHLQVDPENLRGLQVSFWHPWTGEAADQIQQITAAFNETNIWGIQATAANQGGADMLAEQMQAALEEGNTPNVVAAEAVQIQSWQQQYGTLIDLSDYANDVRWGLTAQEVDDFPAGVWSGNEKGDSHYGYPASRLPQILFYNQSWAQELGFPHAPQTPEEFKEQACTAAAANAGDASRENDGTGGWIVSYRAPVMLSWMQSFGTNIDLPDPDTGAFHFNTTPVQDTYTYLRKLYDDNCAWVSRLPTPYDYFATRHALFYSGTTGEIPVQQRAQERNSSADAWTVIAYPYPPQADPQVITNDIQYAIPVNSPEQQLAAWLFVRYLSLPENQARMTRATGAWPVSQAAFNQLSDYRQEYPQWASAAETLIPNAAPAPIAPEWRTVRNILEDASWNMFQVNVEPADVPQVLEVLDATIQEVLQKTGD